MPGIKLGSSICKASTLTPVLSLWTPFLGWIVGAIPSSVPDLLHAYSRLCALGLLWVELRELYVVLGSNPDGPHTRQVPVLSPPYFLISSPIFCYACSQHQVPYCRARIIVNDMGTFEPIVHGLRHTMCVASHQAIFPRPFLAVPDALGSPLDW